MRADTDSKLWKFSMATLGCAAAGLVMGAAVFLAVVLIRAVA